MKNESLIKVRRQQRIMFLLFFAFPVIFLGLAAASEAMGFGTYPYGPNISKYSTTNLNEGLPFDDVTEQVTVETTDYGRLRVVNPFDSPITCMIGKLPYGLGGSWGRGMSPHPSGKGKKGYKRREKIPLNGVSGTFIFAVEPNKERELHPSHAQQLGTIQCARVDQVLDSNRCRPGMNIHACVKQGL